jgi:hypothetical protein
MMPVFCSLLLSWLLALRLVVLCLLVLLLQCSPSVVPPATCGESGGLHCAHCGRDGHVEAFC